LQWAIAPVSHFLFAGLARDPSREDEKVSSGKMSVLWSWAQRELCFTAPGELEYLAVQRTCPVG
jgi:hypothetical protein